MSVNGKPDGYGMLVYDIPQDNMKLYHKIWNKIRRGAIRLNLSVYLIPWGNRLLFQNIIAEAEAATGMKACTSILKYDEASRGEVEELAREQLNREIRDTMKRLQDKALDCLEAGRDIPERYLKTVQERLDTAKSLAVIFGLTDDVMLSMQSALSIFNAELEIANVKKTLREDREHEQSEASATPQVPETALPVYTETLVPPVTKPEAREGGDIVHADTHHYLLEITQ